MGVDLSKLKQRQQEQAQRDLERAGGGIRRWVPSPGKNNIRIMPPWTTEGVNANDFAREVYTHWSIGEGDNRRTFTCPAKTPGLGGPCAICDHVASLRQTGDALDAEQATEFAARQGFVSNIVNLDDPVFTKEDYDKVAAGGRDPGFSIGETKVQTYRYGQTVYTQLLDLFGEPDIGDLTSLQTGRDVVVKKTGSGRKGTRYNVLVTGGARPFEFIGDFNKSVYNLDLLDAPRPQETMQAALGAATPALLPTQPASAPVAALVDSNPTASSPAAEAPPDCFKDAVTFAVDDVMCVGGTDAEGNAFDRCPHYQECGTHSGKLTPPPSRSRRRSAKNDASDDLEKAMLSAISQD